MLNDRLDIPEGKIVDEMPDDTELPAHVIQQIERLVEWLIESDYQEIPEDVQRKVRKLKEDAMRI